MTDTKTVRLRVCALCVQDESVLLVKHRRFATSTQFPEEAWILPGGGVEYGESCEAAVRRELAEETGYEVEVGKLLFIKELVYPFPSIAQKTEPTKHHSLSLCFAATVTGGTLITGRDPEFGEHQLIMETNWIKFSELNTVVVYPPFLAAYIQRGDYTLQSIEKNFYDSNE
jgi:8-oxo-dGTP diphosphatase